MHNRLTIADVVNATIAEALAYDEIRIKVDFPSEAEPIVTSPSVEFYRDGRLIATHDFSDITVRNGLSGIRLRLGGLTGKLGLTTT